MSNFLCGIDYSITGPAITIWDKTKPLSMENVKMFALCDTKKYQGKFGNVRVDPYPLWTHEMDRYTKLSSWAMTILEVHEVESVAIEGYSMGSTGKVFNLAENTGILKYRMRMAGIDYTMPSPTQVKKMFTGKGNSKKDVMIETFSKKMNIDIIRYLGGINEKSGSVNDLCDSFAMLCMHPEALEQYLKL